MKKRTTVSEVERLKEEHIETWRNRPQWYWVIGLLEEVIELLFSLAGLHDDDPGRGPTEEQWNT